MTAALLLAAVTEAVLASAGVDRNAGSTDAGRGHGVVVCASA